jgi:hypothetical protein
MKRILAVLSITILFVFIGFVAWNLVCLKLGVYDSIVLPVAQIPWTIVALVGMGTAHKGWAALLLGGVAAVVSLYRLRHKIST